MRKRKGNMKLTIDWQCSH